MTSLSRLAFSRLALTAGAFAALTLTSCQAPDAFTGPRLVGDDMFDVKFHGQLSASPAPLFAADAEEPIARSAGISGLADDGTCTSRDEVQMSVEVVSVPRDWLRTTLAVRIPPRSRPHAGPKTQARNARIVTPTPRREAQPDARSSRDEVPMLRSIPVVAFLFRDQETTMPVHWWGPRGMRVPADDARALLTTMREALGQSAYKARPFAHELTFACAPDRKASVAVAGNQLAFVKSFEFEDQNDELNWEPGIATAETGFGLDVLPKRTPDGVLLDYRLQVRHVAGVPTAKSRIASNYRFGTKAETQGITLQAPLYSDHVFEGRRLCRDNDAFLVFATNATAEDEVILALIELRSGEQATATATAGARP